MDSVSYLFCRVLKDDKFEDFAGTDIVNKKDVSKLFYIIPNLNLSSLNTILSLMECLTDTSRCSYMELSDKTFKDLFLNGWFEYSLSKQDENGSEKLRFKTKFERTKRLKEVMKYFIDGKLYAWNTLVKNDESIKVNNVKLTNENIRDKVTMFNKENFAKAFGV